MIVRRIDQRCWCAAIFILLVLSGCATATSILQSNIEQDRLTPEQVTNKAATLDAYRHHLQLPMEAPLALQVNSQFEYFLKDGGPSVVQIGLATHKPILGASHVHIVMIPPRTDLKGDLTDRINAVVEGAIGLEKRLPPGSSVTMDWSYALPQFKSPFPAFFKERKGDSLDALLRENLFAPFTTGKHHFVFVVGDHGRLTDRQQQDAVDMAEILVNRGAGISVLAMGEKPDVAFLSKLADTGAGLFDLVSQELRLSSWFYDVAENMNAERLKDITLTLNFSSRVFVGQKWISDKYTMRDKSIVITLPELKQGREKIYLVDVIVPQSSEDKSPALMTAVARYFDSASRKFFTAQSSQPLQYTDDPNQALVYEHPSVVRSMSILKTVDTIDAVAKVLREKRPYKGMAILTKQVQALRAIGEPRKDEELLRDARILEAYAQQLVDFSGDTFQSLKIYRDLNWDTSRYRDAPK